MVRKHRKGFKYLDDGSISWYDMLVMPQDSDGSE